MGKPRQTAPRGYVKIDALSFLIDDILMERKLNQQDLARAFAKHSGQKYATLEAKMNAWYNGYPAGTDFPPKSETHLSKKYDELARFLQFNGVPEDHEYIIEIGKVLGKVLGKRWTYPPKED